MGLRGRLLGLAALLTAACSPAAEQPAPAPALWELTGANGQQGWLFGTIHALPDGYRWRTARLDQAFAASDMLVVEVAALANGHKTAAIFSRLARTPDQPRLSERIAPEYRDRLAKLFKHSGLNEADFSDMETWAAALTLAQVAREGDSGNGSDLALLESAGDKPVSELEGAEYQLSLFDALPQEDQADLLEAVLDEADAGAGTAQARRESWLTGDIAALEEDSENGLLADPQLRDVLLLRRNRDWARQIGDLVQRGHAPFVAVGAAHMIGPEGLPALLARHGYTVKRVQ